MSGPGSPALPGQLSPFLRALAADSPRRLAWVVAVQIAAALTQGAGLLLLVPLLELTGLGASPGRDTPGIGGLVRPAFRAIGVPLTLQTVLVVYVALTSASAAVGAYQTVLSVRYRLEFADGLRERLSRSIAAAQWRHILNLRQSDLLTALTIDVGWVEQGAMAALNLGTAAVVMIVQSAVALRISPAVTCLAAVTGVALAALAWPFAARSRRIGRELIEYNRDALASVSAFLDGLKLAKAHRLEMTHLTSAGTAIARGRNCQIESVKASASASAIQVGLTAALLAVVVGVAVGQFRQPLADLLVLAFIFTRMLGQTALAQQNIHTLVQTLPAFGELLRVIGGCEQAAERGHESRSSRPPRGSHRIALTERLAFDDVSFSYQRPGQPPVTVLRGVSVALPARVTTALVGPSGAGKTTLADLAVGLLAPTAGRVLIDGMPLAGRRMSGWRDSVALVPQDPFLFHDTVRANLLWALPSANEAEMWRALAMASAEDFVRRLPCGLDTPVGDRGARLSGGERQRVALARALLRQPEFLVLDEATNSLDTGNEAVILDALAALRGHMTLLIISHQASVLRCADHVIPLEQGTVAGHVSASAAVTAYLPPALPHTRAVP